MGLKGPSYGTKGYSLPQQSEKAPEAGYFSSIYLFLIYTIFTQYFPAKWIKTCRVLDEAGRAQLMGPKSQST